MTNNRRQVKSPAMLVVSRQTPTPGHSAATASIPALSDRH